MSHTPYTYLLGCSKTNKYYYGVRYAKDCDPKFKAKAKSRKWINNGSIAKMILPTELKHYLDSGWSLGRAGGY